jgi:hypothetical protein
MDGYLEGYRDSSKRPVQDKWKRFSPVSEERKALRE